MVFNTTRAGRTNALAARPVLRVALGQASK